jgi:hypothetical protein
MALTRTRWLAIAMVALLLAPVLILRDAQFFEWPSTARDRLISRLGLAEARVRRTADQLHLMRLRDSISRTVISEMPTTAAYAIDRAFDRESRVLIDSLISGSHPEQPIAARIPVRLVVVLDSVSVVRGQHRRSPARGVLAIDYVLPTDSLRRCLAIARVRPTARRFYDAELRSSISRERLLGPCAYFQQFGLPGRSIRAWLDARGWQFSQRASWTAAPPPWLDGMLDSSYRQQIGLEYVMSTVGRACAGGQDEACLHALLSRAPLAERERQMAFSAGVLSPGLHNPFVHGDNAWLTSAWPLGAREWTLLSDMVRTIGPERFERFWSSELSPEQAFQTAAGTSLATWTREWIETTYHPQATGPTLPAGATGFAGLLMFVALGFAIRAARRRQVG